jgi:hypothetical protein
VRDGTLLLVLKPQGLSVSDSHCTIMGPGVGTHN